MGSSDLTLVDGRHVLMRIVSFVMSLLDVRLLCLEPTIDLLR